MNGWYSTTRSAVSRRPSERTLEALSEPWSRDLSSRCPRSGGGDEQHRECMEMHDRAAQEPTPEMVGMGGKDPAGVSTAPLDIPQAGEADQQRAGDETRGYHREHRSGADDADEDAGHGDAGGLAGDREQADHAVDPALQLVRDQA